MSLIRRAAAEPLVQFLALGALLFLIYSLVAGNAVGTDSRTVVVSAADIETLHERFRRTWGREPLQSELAAVVENAVADEIFYRRALELGLDRNDQAVKRRMRQKLEFLYDDLSVPQPPGDEDLQRFLAENSDGYRRPERYSFEQVFLGEGERAAQVERATEFQALLASGADPGTLGVASLLPRGLNSADPKSIEDRFGSRFVAELSQLEEGRWLGPIGSTFGQHLVRIHRREPERQGSLEELRDRLRDDWIAEQRRSRREDAYRRLREQYEVIIAWPASATP